MSRVTDASPLLSVVLAIVGVALLVAGVATVLGFSVGGTLVLVAVQLMLAALWVRL